MRLRTLALLFTFTVPVFAQTSQTPAKQAGPAITIYNQNFAVVRDRIPLELKAGPTHVQFSGVTAYLEPDSVMLRDCSAKKNPRIWEQNYRSPINLNRMLAMYEGQTIDFLSYRGNEREIVQGKIVRAGNQCAPGQPCATPQYLSSSSPYGGYTTYPSESYFEQPLIEVNGKLQFTLPGTPLFPPPSSQGDLHPVIDWLLESDSAGPTNCELSYLTRAMTWEADYNAIAPEKGDKMDLIGWVTLDNRSGKDFENAAIKLMAGEVSKIQQPTAARQAVFMAGVGGGIGGQLPVSEKAFEEYHLYTLQRLTTLRDRETKQVEFLRRAGVPAKRLYVYEGFTYTPPPNFSGYPPDYLRDQRNFGTGGNTKVYVMQEIANTEQNGLGMPLPRGRMRFYRQDNDGQLEFIGENVIDHTPRGETLRIYTGNAFDLTGQRKRTNYHVDNMREWADESFEITVKNHKKEPVEVTVVEHFYRSANWELTSKSAPFNKRDSNTVEFPLQIPADNQQTVIYTVHYTW